MKMRLLLAETFQTTVEGKTLALGLFADNVVVMTVPPSAPEPSEAMPFAVEIMLLACLSHLETAPTTFEALVKAPTGKVVAKVTGPLGPVPQGQSANIVGRVSPLVIPQAGRYTFSLTTGGGESAEDEFEVRLQRVEGAQEGNLMQRFPAAVAGSSVS